MRYTGVIYVIANVDFADDTKLYFAFKRENVFSLQANIDKLVHSGEARALNMNPDQRVAIRCCSDRFGIEFMGISIQAQK